MLTFVPIKLRSLKEVCIINSGNKRNILNGKPPLHLHFFRENQHSFSRTYCQVTCILRFCLFLHIRFPRRLHQTMEICDLHLRTVWYHYIWGQNQNHTHTHTHTHTSEWRKIVDRQMRSEGSSTGIDLSEFLHILHQMVPSDKVN